MDRIDLLIAHHSSPSFAGPQFAGPQRGPEDGAPLLVTGYVAARMAFWLSVGGFAGFVYSYGWLVR